MKEYTLPRKTFLLWCIRVTFISILVFGGFMFLRRYSEFFRYLAIAVPFLYAVILIFYLPALFKSCKISFINGAVIIKRGVFINNCHILPFTRMIYAQTIKTPLSRLFKLKAITLKAARSRIFVPELSNEDAKSFLSSISKGGEL
ncbi:MAG: hypothetical protein IKB45_03945 [Clostridia bacterium]|nr:hypothetical protein [Clostridia bacterium]